MSGLRDASSGVFPGSGSSQAGTIYKTSTSGTVDSKNFNVNDLIISIVDNASTTTYLNNWVKIPSTLTLEHVETAVGFNFGTAASRNVGTSANNVVQVLSGGKLPVLDGSNLTNLSLPPIPPQKIVQSIYTQYTTAASVNSNIPNDTSIPQINEGVQILSASITPTSTSNKIRATALS